MEFGRDVKEKLCYIASDSDTELKSTAESFDKKQTHMLSDGNIITAGAERFLCASVFPASFIGIIASGVHDTSFHNFMKCAREFVRSCHVARFHDPVPVQGDSNPADLMTKSVNRRTLDKMAALLQQHFKEGRAENSLHLQSASG